MRSIAPGTTGARLREGHWLARFWRQLPGAGDTAIFFRSWYRRVLDDRILGHVEDKALARAFDEINEFEAQQRDYGTLIVKLYFDVDADTQEAQAARSGPPIRGGEFSAATISSTSATPLMPRRSTTCARIPIRAGRRGR